MTEEENVKKKFKHYASFIAPGYDYANPWTSDEYDKLDTYKLKDYRSVVDESRFFYKRDPLASTTMNKIVDIGITKLIVDQGTLTDNEQRIIDALLPSINEFMEVCALEYLVSGLVVPEYEFYTANKRDLQRLRIKRFPSLTLPITMWVRDSATIKINSTFLTDKPSYFVEIPSETIFFIKTKGRYPDGTSDEELYRELATTYPEIVMAVKRDDYYIKIEDDKNIIRSRYLSNSPYPIPYMYPALEALKHKRNIRRMDYSIASRVISAIQLIKLGNDEYPVTEDDEDAFNDIRSQMRHRDSAGKDIERIFQLFTNHTTDIEWVFPDTKALLDDVKYKSVNQDIIYAFGFPRILITGETERSGTSDPSYAVLSPINTMEKIRQKLIHIAENIILDTLEYNSIPRLPGNIRFESINLHNFDEFTTALVELYNSGNLSRTAYAEALGYDLNEQLKQKKEDEDLVEELGLPSFSDLPFSPQSENQGNGDGDKKKEDDTSKKEEKGE